MRDQRGNVRELTAFRLQKFLPRRSVEEEIANGDRGSSRQACLFHFEDLAAVDFDDRPRGFVGRARFEAQTRDGGDRGQGFATESEGGDAQQVFGVLELRGGVTLEG